MITEKTKKHCAESIAYGLNRVATWRRKIDARYPGDPRNAIAAERLAGLAAEACQLTDGAWSQLQPHYCGLDTRWREAIADAARQVGFHHGIKTFPSFVEYLIGALPRSNAA